MEAGACFEIWLNKTLNKKEKELLIGYAKYLHEYQFGYSFFHSFKIPKFSAPEKKQLLLTIGYIPEEVIYICGLATPLFRSAEAILKYFGGYAKIDVGNVKKRNPNINGKTFRIRKKKYISKILIYSSYLLIDWEIVAHYFNYDDKSEIQEIYAIQNQMFKKPS